MRVLGIGHFVAHDANVGVVRDGHIEFACSEERLSRRKRDGTFPYLAARRALAECGEVDITVAAYCDRAQYENGHAGIADRDRVQRYAALQRTHEDVLRRAGTIEFLGHHYSHAAGAYFPSGFSDAVVITYDGGIVCEPWMATVWHGASGGLTPLRRLTRVDGATAATRYSAVTSLLGFRPVHDEGKVTGLSGHGVANDDCVQDLQRAFDMMPDSAAHYDGRFAHRFRHLRAQYSDVDIAASIQAMTEDAVVRLISECVPDPSRTDCAVAGGLFANVRVNLRVKRMGFRRVYVYPPMGDEGLGVGAALAYAAQCGDAVEPLRHLYVGPEYSDDAIHDSLCRSGLSFTADEDVEEATARLLAEGYVVARFCGRPEYGPRALGNRSILYRADDTSANQWLNEKLGRTETMPFAPVTMKEFALEMYTELDGAERCTPYMTMALPATDRMRCLSPCVVHVDGTARPQIVSAEDSPSLHRILGAYHSITGIPSLINTSFNLHGEPIVSSPEDAVRCFLAADLDYLAIGDWIVRHPRVRRSS